MNEEYATLRKEIKYIVPFWKALIIKNKLDNLLQRDSYSSDNSYSVRSLYLDSMNHIDFAEKVSGKNTRKKVRIRIYNGNSSLCKLEVKGKKGDWQYKQSVVISSNMVKEILMGNYSVLKQYFSNSEASLTAYSIMEQGRYKPVVLIEYDRIAYQYPMYNTRITLDMNIRSTESNLDIFSKEIIYTPILCENVVLEVKYNGKLMGFISEVLSQFDLTQSAYSKYCLGCKTYYDFNY